MPLQFPMAASPKAPGQAPEISGDRMPVDPEESYEDIDDSEAIPRRFRISVHSNDHDAP